jgi:hypothetical protein
MNGLATVTEAQRKLIMVLIEETRQQRPTWPHGYQEHPAWVAVRLALANTGMLLLHRDFGTDLAMDNMGVVWVLPDDGTRDGAKVATWRDAVTGIVQAMRRYPELLTLVPDRPSDAKVCGSCGGTGTIGILCAPEHRNMICGCLGLGWVPGVT